MNMSELTKSVASSTGATETATKAMIAAVFDAIAASAAEGDDVAIPGFGKFTVKSRPERQGRNPATGEAMTIRRATSPARGWRGQPMCCWRLSRYCWC